MDYEKELLIDENALDREWIQQSSKYLKISGLCADADKHRKKAKENLDVVRAEVDMAVRNDARSNGEKVTEKVVEARVITDPDYLEASKEVREADHVYNVLLGAVRAFEQRKSALENLTKLYIGGYFSAPVQDNQVEGPSQVDRLGQKQRDALNERKKRRRG